MERIYLKQKTTPKSFKIMKDLGADYIENEEGIFKCNWKDRGNDRVALSLGIDGNVKIGTINPSCDNFIQGGSSSDCLYPKEVDWLSNLLIKIRQEKRLKRK